MPFYRGGFIDTPDIDRRRRENGRASQGRESARIERGCDSYMLIQKDIDLSRSLNDDQKEMLDSMASKPFSADPDCPELTPEQLQKMYNAALERNKN